MRKDMRKQTVHQRGVATIELALVFTLIFGLLWAIISYTFPLVLMQAMNRAVAEAARVGATVNPDDTDVAGYESAVKAVAAFELESQMSWLPPGWVSPMSPSSQTNITFVSGAACTGARTNCILTVRLVYPNYTTNPIVPVITLPVVGQVPRVPLNLEAVSSVAL